MNVDLTLPAFHPGQEILERECERFNVVSCGRRFGKTAHGINRAMIRDQTGMLYGGRWGWFSPNYKFLDEAFRDFIKLIPAPLIRECNKSDRRIELVTGGVLEAWTMDGGDPGRSRKYHGAVIDEAAKARNLSEVWQKAIRATLADYRGEAWFYSTPRGMDDFYDLWQKGQPGTNRTRAGWKSWIMPTSSNPYIFPSEIEDARLDLSDVIFRQEYLAEFIAGGGEYFKREWFKDKLITQEPEGLASILSIDLALEQTEQNDWTVISPFGLNHKRDLFWKSGTRRFKDRSGRVIAGHIVDMGIAHDPDVILVEDTHMWKGIRSSVYEEMEARDAWFTFIEVTPTRAGNDPTKDAKQARARSAQALAQWGRLYLVDEPNTHNVILPELLSFPGGRNDDQVDTLAMAANYFQQLASGEKPPQAAIMAPRRSREALGLPVEALPKVADRPVGSLKRRSVGLRRR